jgi:tetratricopeptide (TPR) repeat protein
VRAALRGLIAAVGHVGHSVPGASTHNLVDRPALRQCVASAIGAEGHGPVVLVGPGGMGKTTAAIDAARRAMESGDFGVVRWMTAASLADLEAAWRSLGTDLGVAGLGDVKKRSELVHRVVTEGLDRTARGSWLLAFDNVETLTDELRELMPVWAGVKTARARVMVTTRDRTGWSALHATVIEVSEMEIDEAVTLLADRAGVDRSASEHTDALLAMVERLGRHPLALMQVGALIREGNRTVASFLKELEDQNIAIDRLTNRGVDRPEGQAHPIEGSVMAALGKILEVAIGRIGESDDRVVGMFTERLLDHYAVMNPDKIEDWIFEADKSSFGSDIKPFVNFSAARDTLMRLGLVTPGPEPGSIRMHRLTQEVVRGRTFGEVGRDAVKVGMRDRWIVERFISICPQDVSSADLQKIRAVLPHMDRVWKGGWGGDGKIGEKWEQGVKFVGYFLGIGGNSYLKLGEPRRALKLLERALAIQEREYGPEHREVAMTLHNLGNAHGALGDPAMQKELLERVLAIEGREYGPEHRNLASTLHDLGIAHGRLGDPVKQKELMERALVIFEREYGPEHREVAIILNSLGNAHGALGDPAKLKELQERALAILEREYGPEHREVAIILNSLGNAHGALGDPAKQKELQERALAILEGEYGLEHREVAMTLHDLGNAHGALGDPAKKKELLERALAIEEREYGPDHRIVASTFHDLGNAHGALGDPAKKKKLLERALAIEEIEYGPNHREVAITLASLGDAHGQLGDPAKQKELQERALAIQEREYGPDHREVANTLCNLGNAHGALGDPAKQKELQGRALAIEEREFGPDHRNVASTLGNLGNAYSDLGDPAKAKELFERALAIFERECGPDHREVARTLTNLGNAYSDLGDPAKAKKLFERALAIQVRNDKKDRS